MRGEITLAGSRVQFVQIKESQLVNYPFTAGNVYFCYDTEHIFSDQVVGGEDRRIQYCRIGAEDDPIFRASPAYTITQEQITRWDASSPEIFYDTKANWDAQPELVGRNHTIYIYTDNHSVDGKVIAGIKVGNGLTYLIDLPFLDDIYWEHVNNSNIHVTQTEKDNWNDKITCYVDPDAPERLVFTKINQIS